MAVKGTDMKQWMDGDVDRVSAVGQVSPLADLVGTMCDRTLETVHILRWDEIGSDH
jgi:hypothetical protein